MILENPENMEAAAIVRPVRLNFSFHGEPLKLAECLKNAYAAKYARKRNNIIFPKNSECSFHRRR
jgi:hypothetical protein